ncbi:hypothetical protein [Streptomyces scopuliridis]|uniref:hypothetical protein n=1 Tax=Streptomyces scopuliridis TaxID=452529 RepID=UPI00368C03AB
MTLINSRMVRGRCPCGAEHAACGPPSTSKPALENLEVAVVGGPLRKYRVTLPGGRTTIMKLNENDAEWYGGEALDPAEAPSVLDVAPEEKADSAQNKARTAANKGRPARGKAAPGGD